MKLKNGGVNRGNERIIMQVFCIADQLFLQISLMFINIELLVLLIV